MKTKLPSQRQRGAMFGLDARIALAIFGGLSIITGAALFAVISEISVTRHTTEMSNFGKAVQAYALDTGLYPSVIEDLISDNATGWNGPYLQMEDTDPGLANSVFLSTGETASLQYLRDTTWTNWATAGGCNNSTNCGIYMVVLVEQDIGNKIDVRVDGVSSPNAGAIRLHVVGSFYNMAYNIGYRP